MILFLFGCDQRPYKEPKPVTYTLQVNYVGNGIGNVPPSDTITVDIYNVQPHLYVSDGISCIIGDDWYHPIATYVRSFKILSKN